MERGGSGQLTGHSSSNGSSGEASSPSPLNRSGLLRAPSAVSSQPKSPGGSGGYSPPLSQLSEEGALGRSAPVRVVERPKFADLQTTPTDEVAVRVVTHHTPYAASKTVLCPSSFSSTCLSRLTTASNDCSHWENAPDLTAVRQDGVSHRLFAAAEFGQFRK